MPRRSPLPLPLAPLALALSLALLAAPAALAGTIIVTVKDEKNQPVADTVVSLVRLDAPASAAPVSPAAPAVVAQSGQEFDPYVTAVTVGTRVSFPNRDKIDHQIYSLSKAKRFAIPLHGPGADETMVFEAPGVVALGCNIHDWMSAYVVVLDTPHFMKTPAAGVARLADLPAGRYRLHIWHPRLTNDTPRELTIAAGDDATQSIAVTLKPDKRIRRAPDSAGGGYKE